MLYHADAELTRILVKMCIKNKDNVNRDMLEYAILVSQIKESMCIIRHFGLLPQLMERAQGIMPDLYIIYQCYELGDKNYKDEFSLTHSLLTSSQPPILGSYMTRLLGKRYFDRQENISLVVLLKILMCAKVNQAHQERSEERV